MLLCFVLHWGRWNKSWNKKQLTSQNLKSSSVSWYYSYMSQLLGRITHILLHNQVLCRTPQVIKMIFSLLVLYSSCYNHAFKYNHRITLISSTFLFILLILHLKALSSKGSDTCGSVWNVNYSRAAIPYFRIGSVAELTEISKENGQNFKLWHVGFAYACMHACMHDDHFIFFCYLLDVLVDF